MAQYELNHNFVPEILPQYPIYISLLPKETQEVIGKTHESTKPAYQMLLQENFSFNQEIDIFEGGPLLSANASEIRSIKKSSLIEVDVTTDSLNEETEYIMGNERLDFRACFGRMQIISKTQALINEEVANALLIQKGDLIRYVAIH